MIPKEKAQELVDKMYMVDDLMGNYPMCFDTAKKCALIAVDELIDQCWSYREIDLGLALEYWEEVKQEIESYEL
jgi:hypothetical protein